MAEIQSLQLVDVSAPNESMCGPNGCGCGSAEAVEPAAAENADTAS